MTELNPTAAALLGFLADDELSGYDLAKTASEVIGDFWHVTRSQVYRELAALNSAGLVAPAGAGPRAKRSYRITEAGREAFAAWIGRQPPMEQVRHPLLLSITFGGWVGREALLEFAASHRSAHEQQLARYRLLRDTSGLGAYLQATIAFGIRYEEAVLAWMADLPAILADAPPPDHC